MLPRFTPEEQHLCIELYRLLAEGEPVPHARIAAAVGVAENNVAAVLATDSIRPLVYYDDQRRVIGFGGLAVVAMHHRFDVDGRTLYTWCAWDALFIPEMLGRKARVRSADPETGGIVQLDVTPTAVTSVSHADAVVSFLLPDTLGSDALKTMASFCHYVFFFTSPGAGAAWAARRPGTFLISVAQAFELARRKNGVQFPELREVGSVSA